MDNARKTELLEAIAGWKKRGMKARVGRTMGNLASRDTLEWRLKIPDTYWLMRESRSGVSTMQEIRITREEAEELLALGVEYNLGSVAMDFLVHGEESAK